MIPTLMEINIVMSFKDLGPSRIGYHTLQHILRDFGSIEEGKKYEDRFQD